MRKLFLGLITLAVFFTGNVNIVNANDVFKDPLADSADQFFLTSPTANQKVKNNVVVSVRAYDNNQTQISGSVEIWDSATCRSSRLKVISSPATFQSNQSTNNTINWDTKSIGDGEYCLKVCLNLKNGNSPYLACNGRRVRVLNNNRLPTITSFPQNLSVYENDPWEYDLNATDPDGDKITYRLVQTANFLSIDPNTGLIKRGAPNVVFTGDIVRYDYTIIVAVDDNFSGSVTQQFVLSILKRPAPVTNPPVNPPTQPNPDPVVPPEETNTAAQITFISPKENQILRGTDNLVQWKIEDEEKLQSGVLLYAADGDIPEFTSIFEFNDESVTSFNWNVSMIPNGKYFLSLSTIDEEGVKTIKASPIFNIQNSTTTPEPEPGVSLIEVTEISPRDGATINLRKPTITGKFSTVEDLVLDLETFRLELNGIDIADECTVDAEGFSCEVLEELRDAEYVVDVSVEDSAGDVVSFESTFNVDGEEIPSFPPGEEPEEGAAPDTVTIFGVTIPRNVVNLVLILCAVTFLLLFIPWILLRIWKKDEDSTDVESDSTTTTTSTSTDYSSPYGSFDTNSYYLPSETKKEIEIPEYLSSVNTEVKTEPEPKREILSDYPDPFPKTEKVETKTETVFEQPSYISPLPVVPTETKTESNSEIKTDTKTETKVDTKPNTNVQNQSKKERRFDNKKKNVTAQVTAEYSEPKVTKSEEDKVMEEYMKYVNPTTPVSEFVEPTPTDVPTETPVSADTPTTEPVTNTTVDTTVTPETTPLVDTVTPPAPVTDIPDTTQTNTGNVSGTEETPRA